MNAPNLEALLTRVQASLRAGDAEAAIAAARAAVEQAPKHSEAWNALGVALRADGRLQEAADAYRRAIASDELNARAHNNLAEILRQRREFEPALAEAERAAALDPRRPEIQRNLAQCRRAVHDLVGAAEAARAAVRLAPADPAAQLLLGKIEHDRNAFAEAVTAYRNFLAHQPDHVETLTDLGMALVRVKQEREAIACFRRALELRPDFTPAEFGLRETQATLIPPWHVPMMNEPQRNLAYREAIRAMVREDDIVLEIGCGAGLLAMMAAEAGARRVVTCEMVPEVAAEATRIIERNGFAARVQVVGKHSSRLEVGVDLPEKADILISEILADDFVGEGVLPSLNDAIERLLKPGARVLPSRGYFMGVLVGGAYFDYLLNLKEVCGFDVASFSQFKPWRQTIAKKVDYDALSDDVALLSYDFNDIQTLKPIDTTIPVTAVANGVCHGVLQWIKLELAPGVHYENHPRTTESVWHKTLYAFPEPIEVRAGDTVPVRIWQREDYLYLTRGYKT